MRSRSRRAVMVATLGTVLAACVPVTVNIHFSQEKLDSAASDIVDMSRRPPGAPDPSTPAPPAVPKAPGSGLDPWRFPLSPREAAAEGVRVDVAQAPKTGSEELRRLTESQNRRLGALQQWIARGCIGEDNQGLAVPRSGQGCSGDVGRLMGEENQDRQAIIETFMRQNHIPAPDAGRVRASFAKAYRDRAPAGAWIQSDKGEWVRK
jgi:uncharacterized protein YdbL (DUF1318 family)